MIGARLVNRLHTRACGILLPIFSLPGPHGIGDLGQYAHNFIDFLADAGQRFWQILPLGPTSTPLYHSPYMSPSAFAGNPLFISLNDLKERGLLSANEIILKQPFSEYYVTYPEVQATKDSLLQRAWQAYKRSDQVSALKAFADSHSWVAPYCLFTALQNKNNHTPWYSWPEEEKKYTVKNVTQLSQEHAEKTAFEMFKQYMFHLQWQALHRHAQKQGVAIIGDLPMYVALDSADVWANPQIFHLHPRTSRPTEVAGVPPDYFSKTGQLWGNPLYRWQDKNAATQEALYQWWEKRLRHNLSQSDVVRIDHFRGFASYWSVPAKEKTAMHGKWLPGPGIAFFKTMEQRIGPLAILAEDLGSITPEVEALRDNLGYPGMNILLFAFDGDPDNKYLPHNCQKNAVIYTGTHDNDTAVGWFLSPDINQEDKKRAKRYARRCDFDAGNFHQDLLHLALSSVCNLAIIPMQDILGFGNDCRVNTPGTVANNWQWRCASRFINSETAAWLRDQVAFFGRLPKKRHPHPNKQATQ